MERKSLTSGTDSGESAAQHVAQRNAVSLNDNRPEPVVQLKTSVKYSGQSYKYDGKNQQVGKKMEAWLDPDHPIQGQSSNLNNSQDEMMDAIRKKYKIKGGKVVKGHLLNDNLGGMALSYNLYPITKAANSAHLYYVENVAKKELWADKGIYYKVDVVGTPTLGSANAEFDCKIFSWNPTTEKMGAQLLGASVKSNLNDAVSKGAYNNVTNTKDNKVLSTVGHPQKPDGFTEPAKAVSELSDNKKQERKNDKKGTIETEAEWYTE